MSLAQRTGHSGGQNNGNDKGKELEPVVLAREGRNAEHELGDRDDQSGLLTAIALARLESPYISILVLDLDQLKRTIPDRKLPEAREQPNENSPGILIAARLSLCSKRFHRFH